MIPGTKDDNTFTTNTNITRFTITLLISQLIVVYRSKHTTPKKSVVHPDGIWHDTVQQTTSRCTICDAQQDNCVGYTAKLGAWLTC